MNAYAKGNVSVPRLMRYDRALSQWYVAQLVAIVLGLLLRAFPAPGTLMTWGEFRGRHVQFDLLYLAALSYFVFLVIMAGVRTKSPMFMMTLPLSTRRIWLSRVFSMLAVSQLPILLVTLTVAFKPQGGAGTVPFDGFTLRLGLHTCAAMAMLTMLLQLPWLELGRINSIGPFAAYAALFSAATVFATMVSAGWTGASAVFLLAAVLAGLWIFLHLPRAFSTMPAEAQRAEAASAGSGKEGTAGPPTVTVSKAAVAISPAMTPAGRLLTLTRVMVNRWNYWIDCLLLLFYSMMAVMAYYDGSRDNPWWLFGFLWVFAALMQSVQMLSHVDFLPVPRRLLYGMTMAPVIVSMLIGVAIGLTAVAVRPGGQRLISFYDDRLQIPLEFYEITNGGLPPVLSSIWGEFHAPEAHPLWRGSDRYIYRPFDAGLNASPRFVALQADRAAEAIFGIERDPLETYEDLGEDYIARARGCCFSNLEIMYRSSDARSRAFALAGIISALFYSLVISLQIGIGGRHGGVHPGNLIVPAAAVLLLGVFVGVVLGGRAGLCEPSFVEAVPAILMRKAAGALPFSTAALWAAFMASCVAGYLMMQSAYRRFEAPLARPAARKTD